MVKYLVTSLAAVISIGALQTQPAPLAIHVTETAGIRRTTYPVSTRVEVPEHALTDVGHVRLRSNGADVPAQFQAGSTWADGTVRQLDVDFNVSIGPRETLDYAVEYGVSITAPAAPRGLAVTEGPGVIQVGNVTFSATGMPLIRSVKYRDEDIADGPNGVAVIDAAGQSHDLLLDDKAGAGPTVIKRGPLDAVLRYAGQVAIDPAHRLPFVITVEMPNSKTWVKVTATVQDPQQQVRAVVMRTPLALGAYPWLWDLGTTNGTYGVFRAATDGATLAQAMKPGGKTDWHVDLATGGRPAQPIEAETDAPAEARWGHIQGAKEAIAFAVVHPENGSSTLSVDGAGHLSIQFAPAQPSTEHTLTVYEHFVASPAQVGAATTPAAMLAPLVVR